MGKVQVRPLSEAEQAALQKETKSSNGTVVRRSQALLMSAREGLNPRQIAERLGYNAEMIRRVIHRFNTAGISAVYPRKKARQDDQRAFDDAARERLKEMVRRSPREFGIESSVWTLPELARVCYKQRLTDRLVDRSTVSGALRTLGIRWKKVKRVIQSPDEHYTEKKTPGLAQAQGPDPSGVVVSRGG